MLIFKGSGLKSDAKSTQKCENSSEIQEIFGRHEIEIRDSRSYCLVGEISHMTISQTYQALENPQRIRNLSKRSRNVKTPLKINLSNDRYDSWENLVTQLSILKSKRG